MTLTDTIKNFAHVNVLLFVANSLGCASTSYDEYGGYGDYGVGDYNYDSASTENVGLDKAEAEAANVGSNAPYQQDNTSQSAGEGLNNSNEEYGENLNGLDNQSDYLANAQGINNADSESLNAILNETNLDTTFSDEDFAENEAYAPMMGQSANEIPGNDYPATGAAEISPRSNGMVKYALRKVDIIEAESGTIVGTYARGDHPVIYVDASSASFSDGTEANWTAFTEEPIGRDRKPGDWR